MIHCMHHARQWRERLEKSLWFADERESARGAGEGGKEKKRDMWREKERKRDRGKDAHSLVHSCLICKVLRNHFFFKRMKRFFFQSQKGPLSFLGSLSARDVISINYLPHPTLPHHRDWNMLALFCFSHLIALFTEQLPMDNKCTHWNAYRTTGRHEPNRAWVIHWTIRQAALDTAAQLRALASMLRA